MRHMNGAREVREAMIQPDGPTASSWPAAQGGLLIPVISCEFGVWNKNDGNGKHVEERPVKHAVSVDDF